MKVFGFSSFFVTILQNIYFLKVLFVEINLLQRRGLSRTLFGWRWHAIRVTNTSDIEYNVYFNFVLLSRQHKFLYFFWNTVCINRVAVLDRQITDRIMESGPICRIRVSIMPMLNYEIKTRSFFFLLLRKAFLSKYRFTCRTFL